MTDKQPFKGDLDLNFFPSAEFSSLEDIEDSQEPSIIARNALRLLMMGWTPSWWDLSTWTTIKAILFDRNTDFVKEMRLAFQEGFDHIFTQLEGKDLNEQQKEQVQLFLSNCFTVLPFSDLTPYESLKIPQCIDNKWVMVDYQVVPIELTPQSGFSSYFLKDHDRVFAYGLQPLVNPKATSHLIFMGTTYPAGQGFLTTVTTDLKGFETPGKSLYNTGRKRLIKWLDKQHDKVHVCGMSLGGSLSLLLALDQGEKLSRVDALNPAGLHDPWFNKSKYDRWDEMEDKPQVVIQKQDRDPVSNFGVWKEDWEIINVKPPAEKQGPNALTDHFLNYAGFKDTEFSYLDPIEENKKSRLVNTWVYSLARGVVYYTALLPYNFVIRPILSFIWDNKAAIALALLPITGVAAIIALSILGYLSFITAGIIAVSALSILALAYFNPSEVEEVEVPKTHAKLHDPDLPRNPTMDIFNPDYKIDVELTYKEVHDYYDVTRCLVKKKSFFPCEQEQEKMLHNGQTKKALLQASEDPSISDIKVTLKTTKAKAAYIKSTLTFIAQIGRANEEQLQKKLDKHYSEYTQGKTKGMRT